MEFTAPQKVALAKAKTLLDIDYIKYPENNILAAVELLSYKDTPKALPKEEDSNYPILYVFRHGQTVDNANFVFSGWRDSDLTDLGTTQAQELSMKLANKKIDMLVSSDQLRAIRTMGIAISLNETAKDREIIRDIRLRERMYGDLQGTSKLIMALENPEQLKLERRSYSNIPPHGESIEMVCKRVQEFIDEIIPKMKEFKINIAISCHGNSIRGFRRHFEHLTDEQTATVETPLAQDYAAYSVK